MALLKEDNGFTHVIAIDFGTGASGYSSPHSASQSPPNNQTLTANNVSKSSTPVTAVMIKKHLPPSSSTTNSSF